MTKTNVLETCREKKFLRKKILKKCTRFKEGKGTKYIQRNVYFGIIVFSSLSPTKPCLRLFLICFVREIKGFYQSSIQNEVDFSDIMNIFSQISWQIVKVSKN